MCSFTGSIQDLKTLMKGLNQPQGLMSEASKLKKKNSESSCMLKFALNHFPLIYIQYMPVVIILVEKH